MSGRFWVNRSLCEVLSEMRTCYKTRNFAPLLALIEEAQSMGNRMEAGLEDQSDLVRLNELWHKKKQELKKLDKMLAEAQSAYTGLTGQEWEDTATIVQVNKYVHNNFGG